MYSEFDTKKYLGRYIFIIPIFIPNIYIYYTKLNLDFIAISFHENRYHTTFIRLYYCSDLIENSIREILLLEPHRPKPTIEVEYHLVCI